MIPFVHLPEDFVPERLTDQLVLRPGPSMPICELEGPGCIRRLGLALPPDPALLRRLILRAYWDDESAPSVEAPLVGLLSEGAPLDGVVRLDAVMPFARKARLELANATGEPISFRCQVDWHAYPSDTVLQPLRFHAQWRREYPTEPAGEDYLVLDALGKGRVVGFRYVMAPAREGGPGSAQGEDLYIDGEGEPIYLRAEGRSEFGELGAGFRRYDALGLPFRQSVQVRLRCGAADVWSTAHWYQEEPHRPFYRLPPADRLDAFTQARAGEFDVLKGGQGSWWLCGPYENQDNVSMVSALQAERELEIPDDFESGFAAGSPWRPTLETEGPRARWVRQKDAHGFVDFNHVFRPKTEGELRSWPAVAVASTTIQLRANSRGTFHIGWDDELTLRVNDTRVLERAHHSRFRREEVPVSLRAGMNKVVIKLSNARGLNAGGWAFSFRGMLPDDTQVYPMAVP